jgi:hypothetical protein
MRLTALLLALVFQILPLQFWSGLTLCLHPDGRGFVVSAGNPCDMPCDADQTHCTEDVSTVHPDSAPPSVDAHCDDLPLMKCTVVTHEELRRPFDAPPDSPDLLARTSVYPVFLEDRRPGGRSVAGGTSPPFTLACLNTVVLRC